MFAEHYSPSKNSTSHSNAYMNSPVKQGTQNNGGLAVNGYQLNRKESMSNIDKNSNFMPAAENKMQFRVIDYENDGHRNDKDLYSNTTSHAGSAIQIGIMDAGNMNKDVERDREIDMAELNALLGN